MAPFCCCYDEENDGIPPICKKNKWCPFHLENPIFADNKYVLMFCNIGWPYFDRKRRQWQGFAFGWTLTAFIFTIFGCLAVINDKEVLRASFWSWAKSYSGFYKPESGENYAELFMGLRAYYANSCVWTNVTGTEFESDTRPEDDGFMYKCTEAVVNWDPKSSGQTAWAGKCAEASLGAWFGAILSCFTMIFAMIGAIHRMRFVADAPQQKLLGCITDSIGTVTLALTLMNLEKDCFRKLEESDFVDPIDPSIVYPKMYFLRGGGYLIYWVFCFSGCLVRAVIHWLTPLPGMGVGAFTFRLPEMGFNGSMSELVHRMGDGIEEGIENLRHGLEDMGKSVRQFAPSIIEGEDAHWEERPMKEMKSKLPASKAKGNGGRRSSIFANPKRASVDNDTWVERHNVRKKESYEVELYDMSGEV
mmetsp:Transcript_22166/g.46321  ORF Transcript_22166/g.46321 Transcript_22166/m.46321 type:complete len:418 (-) Transcript_22166:33-1286(-)